MPTTASTVGRSAGPPARRRRRPRPIRRRSARRRARVARATTLVIPSPRDGELVLLAGRQQPRGEARGVQRGPEPVPRAREMVSGRRGEQAGVDPAEQRRAAPGLAARAPTSWIVGTGRRGRCLAPYWLGWSCYRRDAGRHARRNRFRALFPAGWPIRFQSKAFAIDFGDDPQDWKTSMRSRSHWTG